MGAKKDASKNFAPIGACVVFDLETRKFLLASPLSDEFSPYDIDLSKQMLLGIVMRQHRDFSVDVLLCEYLVEKPIPMLESLRYSHESKANLVRNYLRDVFKKYTDNFKESVRNTGANEIADLNIAPFSVEDAHIIADNPCSVFSGLSIVLGPNKFKNFYLRLFESNARFYAEHNNKKTYLVMFNWDSQKPGVLVPEYTKFDLLCTFKNVRFEFF